MGGWKIEDSAWCSLGIDGAMTLLRPNDKMPTDMTLKEQPRQIVDQLPEDCTIEPLQHQLYVLEKVRRAQESVARGDSLSHEEVGRRLESWLKR